MIAFMSQINVPVGCCRRGKCECPGSGKNSCGPNVEYTACPHFEKLGFKYVDSSIDPDGKRRIHLETAKDSKRPSSEAGASSGSGRCQRLFSDIAPDQKIKLAGMS